MYWLNGLARTGKTAIAQTIAERTFADGQLGASFFCSRDSSDRSNLRLIFPTLAVQLAYKYADFRSFIIPLVQPNPGIAYESLENQMQKLIVQPLQEFNISTVVIIDGLDECKDREPTSAILSVLAQFVSEIPKVKFLVISRPETHIQEGFRLPLLAEVTEVFVLHEVEKSQVDNDIWLFFRRGLLQVVGPFPDYFCSRPTEAELDVLCAWAGGSFAYAVAAAKFINDWSSDSRRRLDLLLQPPSGKLDSSGTPLLPRSRLFLFRKAFATRMFLSTFSQTPQPVLSSSQPPTSSPLPDLTDPRSKSWYGIPRTQNPGSSVQIAISGLL